MFFTQYFIIQFNIFYERDGYQVHFKYIKNFYKDEHLNLSTGAFHHEYDEYPFRFMITAIDNETGRLPPDLYQLG